MRRHGVEFHVNVNEMGEFRGKGHIVLTTRRLVVVNRDEEMPDFASFSFPLTETHNENFEQGMGGRFHLHAHCRPFMELIPDNAHFKLWLEDDAGSLVF